MRVNLSMLEIGRKNVRGTFEVPRSTFEVGRSTFKRLISTLNISNPHRQLIDIRPVRKRIPPTHVHTILHSL
jgi:hypothetical protein